MPLLEREPGSLYYEVTDLTPPWVENPGTVVFCHGVSTTHGIWSNWLPVLAGDYRLVRFDTRGFGRSTAPGAGFPWTLDLLVDDVMAVARAAGAETFHLVGESLGGTVALALAIAHGDALESLTVCSAAHRGGSIQRAGGWRAYVAEHGMEAWSRMMMDLRFHDDGVPAPVAEWFHREQAATSADSTLDLADLLLGTDLAPMLPRITAPTLILAPNASPFISLEIFLDMHRRIPHSELQVFADARHGLVCSHGAACAQTLKQFLARRGLQATG